VCKSVPREAEGEEGEGKPEREGATEGGRCRLRLRLRLFVPCTPRAGRRFWCGCKDFQRYGCLSALTLGCPLGCPLGCLSSWVSFPLPSWPGCVVCGVVRGAWCDAVDATAPTASTASTASHTQHPTASHSTRHPRHPHQTTVLHSTPQHTNSQPTGCYGMLRDTSLQAYKLTS